MEEFKSISNNSEAEIVEKKSKFIAHIFYVENIEDAEQYIKNMKNKYHDARHNVFAYAIETSDGGIAVKYNDDGEPQGTAGSPILKIILENNLSNILVVVTRYFGGILLGTGGLVKAYSTATLKALEKNQYVKKIIGYEIKIILKYNQLDQFKYYTKINRINIIKIEYLENIELIAEITKEGLMKIKKDNKERNLEYIKCDILTQKIIDI